SSALWPVASGCAWLGEASSAAMSGEQGVGQGDGMSADGPPSLSLEVRAVIAQELEEEHGGDSDMDLSDGEIVGLREQLILRSRSGAEVLYTAPAGSAPVEGEWSVAEDDRSGPVRSASDAPATPRSEAPRGGSASPGLGVGSAQGGSPLGWICRGCLAPNMCGLECDQCGLRNPELLYSEDDEDEEDEELEEAAASDDRPGGEEESEEEMAVDAPEEDVPWAAVLDRGRVVWAGPVAEGGPIVQAGAPAAAAAEDDVDEFGGLAINGHPFTPAQRGRRVIHVTQLEDGSEQHGEVAAFLGLSEPSSCAWRELRAVLPEALQLARRVLESRRPCVRGLTLAAGRVGEATSRLAIGAEERRPVWLLRAISNAFDPTGTIIGIVCLHVDDFLMGIKQGDPEGAKIMKDLQKEIDFGEVKYARKEQATFCGRAYKQDKDGSINVTMEAYVKSGKYEGDSYETFYTKAKAAEAVEAQKVLTQHAQKFLQELQEKAAAQDREVRALEQELRRTMPDGGVNAPVQVKLELPTVVMESEDKRPQRALPLLRLMWYLQHLKPQMFPWMVFLLRMWIGFSLSRATSALSSSVFRRRASKGHESLLLRPQEQGRIISVMVDIPEWPSFAVYLAYLHTCAGLDQANMHILRKLGTSVEETSAGDIFNDADVRVCAIGAFGNFVSRPFERDVNGFEPSNFGTLEFSVFAGSGVAIALKFE
ncbi:unnamed protein product, partial [Prorocentrum cordatum]